jgi:hypothetical protein
VPAVWAVSFDFPVDLIRKKGCKTGRFQGVPFFYQSQLRGQFALLVLAEQIDAAKFFAKPDDGRKGEYQITQGALVDN